MIDGKKIEEVAQFYCKTKGYKKYSFKRFCEENKLSYTEWTDFKNNRRNNTKVIQELLNIFPSLNLNWLLKDDLEPFTDIHLQESEGEDRYFKKINEELQNIEIQIENIKKMLQHLK